MLKKLLVSVLMLSAAGPLFAQEPRPQGIPDHEGLLKAAIAYLSDSADESGVIAVTDPQDNVPRRFQLKGLWDNVTIDGDKGIYTVSVDADELEMKKPNEGMHPWLNYTVLYVDALREADAWKITGVRIGSRHLRQTMEGATFEDSYYHAF